jgi:hypothetical protein
MKTSFLKPPHSATNGVRMRSILQLGLMVLMLLGAGTHAWGKVAVCSATVAWGCAPSTVLDHGGDAPPALLASGEAAAWGLDVASAVQGQHAATPTTAGPVVVTFHGTAFLMSPGTPPPAIGFFRTTNQTWVAVGPNLYAYVKQNPWSNFDAHGLWSVGEEAGGWLSAAGDIAHAIGHQLVSTITGRKDAFDFFPGMNLVEHEINGTKPTLPDVTTAKGRGQAALGVALLFEGARGSFTKPKGGAPPTTSGQKTAVVNKAIVEAEVPSLPKPPALEMRTYHRFGDSPEAVLAIMESGELHGTPPRGPFASNIPKVQAHEGPLPMDAKNGWEFQTAVPEDTGLPPHGGLMSGISWSRGSPGVRDVADGVVGIPVKVTKTPPGFQPPKPVPKKVNEPTSSK